MIIIDMEWNRGYDKKPLDELLQIGAVRVERLGGPIVDTFNVFIRPKVHKRFGPGAKELPELDRSIASKVDFRTALAAFLKWRGEETEYATWGGDDLLVLVRNCEYWGLPVPEFPVVYDLQGAFGRTVGSVGRQLALWWAVEYCRLPEPFTFHNALNDAAYAAVVAEYIRGEDLRRELPMDLRRKKLPRFSEEPFPAKPRLRVGPMAAREQVLDAKRSRRPACPLCGREAWVTQWREGPGRQYFSPFRCPDHGRFLCRLTVTPMENGQWRGRLAVPALTGPVLLEYQQAMEAEPYRCKGTGRKRRRRRRKRTAVQI